MEVGLHASTDNLPVAIGRLYRSERVNGDRRRIQPADRRWHVGCFFGGAMRQPQVDRLAAIAFVALSAGACATTLKPPATNSGPALSSSGVQVAVVGQACSESYQGTLEQWLDETVQLQVRNGSGEPVSIHRDRFRLLAPDGTAFAGRNSSAEPVDVARGETQTIELTFSARGLDCSQVMRLDPAAAITAGKSPVVVGSVAFVPSRAL